MLILVALLLSGTSKIGLLTNTYAQVEPADRRHAAALQQALFRLVPFDSSRGEEGVTAQGVVLIALLGLIAVAAWRGLSNVLEGFNRWTWVALALVALTLLVAAVGMDPVPGQPDADRFPASSSPWPWRCVVLAWLARRSLSRARDCATGCGNRGASSNRSSRCCWSASSPWACCAS